LLPLQPFSGHARTDSAIDGTAIEPKDGETATSNKESVGDKLAAIAEVKPVNIGSEQV